MCGITGITDTQIEKLEEAIQKMTKVISHRGPDDDGYYVDDLCAIGMRRLSIIDIEHGRQPITSRDGRYLIFFNGEIYNHEELRNELQNLGDHFDTKSDTEVILKLYERYGSSSFKKLRGMFAIAIYDTEKKIISLARDPFGIKPLYYWKRGNKIAAFGSEIKSILALKGFRPEVNDDAVYNYLSYQYNPLNETFFKGVYKLPPGHILYIDLKTGVFEIEQYFNFMFKPNEALSEEDTKKEILETMEDSVRHHMLADVPVGSFLSGGIDSSIIATLMQNESKKKRIKTFTVGFDYISEGKESGEMSAYLGTDHSEITVNSSDYFDSLPKVVYHFDEPVADPSAVGLYFLAREARKHVKVVLSGEGADELFGGYNIYLEPFSRNKIMWVPRTILMLISKLPIRGHKYAQRALKSLEDWYIGNASIFSSDEVETLWKGGDVYKNSLKETYGALSELSDSTKMQYIDIKTWLIGDILAKADKMTMAHSLELRVPFLDIEVAKIASKMPDRFKWKNKTTKYLLREAFKSILPEATRQRKKLGFPTPIRKWIKEANQDFFDLIVKNDYINKKLNVVEINKIIKEHLDGSRDNSRKIYLLLILAIWYNVFIKEIEH